MTAVRSVLLIPAEGDPLGLLAEGPCGARPPMVWSIDEERAMQAAVWETGVWCAEWRSQDDQEGSPWTGALVLAWKGKPVAEGIDRLSRVRDWDHPVAADLAESSLDDIAMDARTAGIGALVLLDADGREIAP